MTWKTEKVKEIKTDESFPEINIQGNYCVSFPYQRRFFKLRGDVLDIFCDRWINMTNSACTDTAAFPLCITVHCCYTYMWTSNTTPTNMSIDVVFRHQQRAYKQIHREILDKWNRVNSCTLSSPAIRYWSIKKTVLWSSNLHRVKIHQDFLIKVWKPTCFLNKSIPDHKLRN